MKDKELKGVKVRIRVITYTNKHLRYKKMTH
jgi:hypothetical protein